MKRKLTVIMEIPIAEENTLEQWLLYLNRCLIGWNSNIRALKVDEFAKDREARQNVENATKLKQIREAIFVQDSHEEKWLELLNEVIDNLEPRTVEWQDWMRELERA